MTAAMSTMAAVKRTHQQTKPARQKAVKLVLAPTLVRDAHDLVSIYDRVDWDQVIQTQCDTVHLDFESAKAVQAANRIWLELAASLPGQRNAIIIKIKRSFQRISLPPARIALDKRASGGKSAHNAAGLLNELVQTQDPCRFAELCVKAVQLHSKTSAENREIQKRQAKRGAGNRLLPPPDVVTEFWLGPATDQWMSVPLRMALAEPIVGLCRRITGVNTGATALLLDPGEEQALELLQRFFVECGPEAYRVPTDDPFGGELKGILDDFVPKLRKLIDDCRSQGEAVALAQSADSPLVNGG